MDAEKPKFDTWVCTKCETEYAITEKECPNCKSKTARPGFIKNERKIAPRFTVSVQSKFGQKDKRIIKISKWWYAEGERQNNQLIFNIPEEWEKCKKFIDSELTQKCGWVISTEQIEQIAKKEKKEQDNQKEVVTLIEQHPSIALKILENLNFESEEEIDPKFIADIITASRKATYGGSEKLKTDIVDFINKLKGKESPKGLEELNTLLGKWSMLQLSTITGIISSRLQTIDFFEKIIEKDQTFEIKGDGSIHRTLEKSMWLFDEEWWLAQSNKSLRTYIQSEFEKKDKSKEKKRPDFVCVDMENRIIFVELKRPSHEINKKDIDQLESYLVLAEKYLNGSKDMTGYMVGKQINNEAKAILKRRTGLKFYPFNELIQKAKKRYQEYLKALEKIEEQSETEIN